MKKHLYWCLKAQGSQEIHEWQFVSLAIIGEQQYHCPLALLETQIKVPYTKSWLDIRGHIWQLLVKAIASTPDSLRIRGDKRWLSHFVIGETLPCGPLMSLTVLTPRYLQYLSLITHNSVDMSAKMKLSRLLETCSRSAKKMSFEDQSDCWQVLTKNGLMTSAIGWEETSDCEQEKQFMSASRSFR